MTQDNNQKKYEQVRIQDAFKEDAGRGRIRIDPNVIEALNLENGDVIEMHHPVENKTTVALLYPGKLEDKGTNTIRIDQSLRRNLGASIDDIVDIRRILASEAIKITFVGLVEPVIVRNTTQLARKLENRVITKGDILSFYAMRRRVDLIVVDYMPKTDAVRILADTKIILSEQSFKDIKEFEESRMTYEDIGGLKNQIKEVRDLLELAINHPEFFKKIGIEAHKGILFHGASGTGKTLLARIIKHEIKAHFITIDGSDIFCNPYGQAETLRRKFEEAKDYAPSILFIDFLDTLCAHGKNSELEYKNTMLNQLCSLMDGIVPRGEVIVIGATNRIEEIDPSLRRSGRFGKEIEFTMPNDEERQEILSIIVRPVTLSNDVDLRFIAEKTVNFSGADLQGLVREAAFVSIREVLPNVNVVEDVPLNILEELKVKMEHFTIALSNNKK